MSSEVAANMRATTEGFVHSFDGRWTTGATLSYRSPHCKHTMLPSALGLGTKEKNNDEWAAHFKRLDGIVTNAETTIHDYLAVPNERRAVCRTSLTADTSVGPYANDYVWFFTFDEDGRKIVSITEFMDSKAGAEMLRKLTEAGLFEKH
ncbi:hypothetical protein LTR56_003604 [Elasticomyces elasticus]|nr:hypothetical protein LTR56_003604 [Elasticomyces elasticus]KAK3663737.1 hypothetical protein LTR22_005438 [Elasticomyces elasticus]KAK4927255.1 hypothetical protein LTR49_005920 [Elasticomyces elasticus]KAK5767339.1 hypothetical protein LTS12_002492 [Elasticomyces elasticus]